MKGTIITGFLAAGITLLSCACQPGIRTVKSPDGRLSVNIDLEKCTYDIQYDGRTLIKDARAQMTLIDSSVAWSGSAKIIKKEKAVTEHIDAPFYRQASFDYTYNSLSFDFGDGFGMEWRVSDDGAAYRFTTSRCGETTILSETGEFVFAQDWPVTVAKSANPDWMCSFEGFYNTLPLSKGGTDSLCFMPASVACSESTGEGALRVTIAESGVLDFPGSFLLPVSGKPAMRILHAPVPDKNYVASSCGERNYPWRILKVTTRDADIPQDNLIYALAGANRIGDDLGWIKPGYSAWEWWNDWGLEDTGFKPGINDETYKAYIDFAAANGLEYAILDEGWGKRGPGQNLLVPIPGLHLQELSDYARAKGVRLVLWAVFNRLYQDAESVFSTYEDMGIAGFKPDFFNRNDQEAVNRLCEVADAAARHHIFMDFHGAFPPMGLNRTYPNILNMEGIAGLEQCKWLKAGTDFMKHDCTLSYLRTMAGISDYTPGAMTNYGDSASFVTDFSHPGSQGTRAHQVALYGIFDSPLTMLCDSPDAYRKNQETTDFISSLPRNYTEKKVLSGVLGEYVVVARKGTDGGWYIFGITDQEARTVSAGLDFLHEGEWQAVIFRDGTGEGPIIRKAARESESYVIEKRTVTSGDSLTVPLSSGGGFVVKLSSLSSGTQNINFSTALFHLGDDSSWSDPELDDQNWSKVSIAGADQAKGITKENSYAWYRIHFTLDRVPDEDAVLFLRLGYVDDSNETFLNGKSIGTTPSYNQPSIYRIRQEDLHADGDNVIAVRIRNNGGQGGIRDERDGWYPNGKCLEIISNPGDYIGDMLTSVSAWSRNSRTDIGNLAHYTRYSKDNEALSSQGNDSHRVVLMGDSITERWPGTSPSFFKSNDIIGRGIGGETSGQFLLRFQNDVIELHPSLVVINYGTNDIAENAGKYDEDQTFLNVKAMCGMAAANGIKVVLASTLPHGGFLWNPSVKDAMPKILSLNARVRMFAEQNGITYVDYFSAMVSKDGKAMRKDLSADGVHPNAQGYAIMESLLLPIIKSLR